MQYQGNRYGLVRSRHYSVHMEHQCTKLTSSTTQIIVVPMSLRIGTTFQWKQKYFHRFPQIAQIKVIYKMLPLLLLLHCMTTDIHMAGILKADAQDDIT